MPVIRRDYNQRRHGPQPVEAFEFTSLNRRPECHEYVYLVSDARGRLLYVGVTRDVYQRFAQHARQSPWYPDMAYMRVEIHKSRALAEERERHLIQIYDPPFNRDHRVPQYASHMRNIAVLVAAERVDMADAE